MIDFHFFCYMCRFKKREKIYIYIYIYRERERAPVQNELVKASSIIKEHSSLEIDTQILWKIQHFSPVVFIFIGWWINRVGEKVFLSFKLFSFLTTSKKEATFLSFVNKYKLFYFHFPCELFSCIYNDVPLLSCQVVKLIGLIDNF